MWFPQINDSSLDLPQFKETGQIELKLLAPISQFWKSGILVAQSTVAPRQELERKEIQEAEAIQTLLLIHHISYMEGSWR